MLVVELLHVELRTCFALHRAVDTKESCTLSTSSHTLYLQFGVEWFLYCALLLQGACLR
jgi:hypothetical protein